MYFLFKMGIFHCYVCLPDDTCVFQGFLGFLYVVGFKDDPVVTCTWSTLLFQLDISVKTCIQWPTPKTMTKNCKKKIQESMASLWHSSRRRHFQTFGTRENCGEKGDFWSFGDFRNCSITHPKWVGSCWTTFLFGSPHGLAKPGSWRVSSNSGGISRPSGTTSCKRLMVVVSDIFYFHPYLGKISNLTNIFQMGWNHQPGLVSGWLVPV